MPTLCCLVFVGLIGLVVSQMPIQNIQVLDEDGEGNEMVRISKQLQYKIVFKIKFI